MPPRVSILVPAYNAESTVAVTFDSVLAQDFKEWEIVAVDDGSSDATPRIFADYARRDPRIRIAHNDRNLGMTAHWHRCLALATGDFVIKLDSDDVFKPGALASFLAPFDDLNVIAVGVRTLSTDEQLEPFDGIPGDDAMMRAGIDPYADHVLAASAWYAVAAHGHQLWASSSFMTRRVLLVSRGGFDERFGCAADTEMMWRLMEGDGKIAHVARVGSLYRIRRGSVSDVYRKQDWLTWEGTAANLLTLSRVRTHRKLPRSLRMHYVRLWRRWQTSTRALPPNVESKLASVVSEVSAPPFLDVAMTRARDAVSAS